MSPKKIVFCIVFLICIFYFSSAEGQGDNYRYFELSPRFGNIIQSPRSHGHLQDTRIAEVLFSLGKQTTGEAYWEEFFKYPKFGFRLGITNYFAEPLGEAARLGMFIQAPFFRIQRFSLEYNIGFGIGYSSKKYDRLINPNNDYISRNLSASIELILAAEYQLSKRLDLFTGTSFSHFSNGSTKLPNLGINGLLFFTGIRYHQNQGNRDRFKQGLEKPFFLKNELYTFIAPSFLEKNLEGNHRRFFASTLELGYRRRFHPYLKWGAGIDIMYNGTEKYEIEESKRNNFHNLSQAFFSSFEVLYNKVSLHVGLGVCVLYSAKPRGVVYERAGVFYYFNKKETQFLGVSIKANMGVAEYIEWTYGIKLKQF